MKAELVRVEDTGESVVRAVALDDEGHVVVFGADRRAMLDVPIGAIVEIPSWAILSRSPAFQAWTERPRGEYLVPLTRALEAAEVEDEE